jgi:hypothetical protein
MPQDGQRSACACFGLLLLPQSPTGSTLRQGPNAWVVLRVAALDAAARKVNDDGPTRHAGSAGRRLARDAGA